MKLILIIFLMFVIMSSYAQVEVDEVVGKGKYCDTVSLFSGLTEYGEFKPKKVRMICNKNKKQLEKLVKQQITEDAHIAFKATSKFREKALAFEGFYTDPVTGYKCVNATVVNKIQSSSQRGSIASLPFNPVEGGRRPSVTDSSNASGPLYHGKVAISMKIRACSSHKTEEGKEEEDALKAEEEAEEASARWITVNEYEVPPYEEGKLFTLEQYTQIKAHRTACKRTVRFRLSTAQRACLRGATTSSSSSSQSGN